MADDQVFTQRTGEEPVAVAPVQPAREAQEYLLHEFYAAVTQGGAPGRARDDLPGQYQVARHRF